MLKTITINVPSILRFLFRSYGRMLKLQTSEFSNLTLCWIFYKNKTDDDKLKSKFPYVHAGFPTIGQKNSPRNINC